MIETIKNDLIDGNINPLIFEEIYEKNKDLMVNNKKILFQITTPENQNNNVYENISTINLGECENILRKYYKLEENDTLLIFKIEIYKEGLLIPIIEYEVYNLRIKKKLDLNICNKSKIKITHRVSINEDMLFKYNSSDDYYNDICYPYTTENFTDITLDDRRNEYLKDNMSLCEVNCEYDGYNSENKTAECECEIKIKIPLMEEIVINKDILLNNFMNINNAINIVVIKCYEVLFSPEGLIKNIGSYILLFILLIIIICFIIFLINGYQKLYHQIKIIAKVTERKNKNNKDELNKVNNNKNIGIKDKKNEIK